MARTYYVKRAQQRYATKPVLNPDGTQKQTPKMRRGVQMTSKSGRPVFMRLTERDLDRPLPMPKCSKCGETIAVGQPYKYTEAYNRTIIRCGPCPAPQVWEYSSSLSARIAQIQHEAQASIDNADDEDSLTSARDDIAGMVRELAEEKQEAAQNMEDGFGHETEQSNEIRDQGDQLESWADEIEGVDFPDTPEPEEQDCEECEASGEITCTECGGTGEFDDHSGCENCDGSGNESCNTCHGACQVPGDEPTEEQLSEWLDEARQALQDAVDGCPL